MCKLYSWWQIKRLNACKLRNLLRRDDKATKIRSRTRKFTSAFTLAYKQASKSEASDDNSYSTARRIATIAGKWRVWFFMTFLRSWLRFASPSGRFGEKKTWNVSAWRFSRLKTNSKRVRASKIAGSSFCRVSREALLCFQLRLWCQALRSVWLKDTYLIRGLSM